MCGMRAVQAQQRPKWAGMWILRKPFGDHLPDPSHFFYVRTCKDTKETCGGDKLCPAFGDRVMGRVPL